nr:hypothetical protein GCM10020063_084870 [Dactylosporangium thailandense]
MRRTCKPWFKRVGALLALLTGVFVALVPAAPARADAEDIERMSTELGLPRVAGQYVFLVDTSGSMERPVDLYSGVKEAIGNMLAAADPDDDLTLVSFDRSARVWQGKVGSTPDTVLDHLPEHAAGDYTDIGTALDRAVAALESPESPSVATIVLLTDGEHNKAPYSAYPYKTGSSWDRLRQRAEKAVQAKESVSAFAVPLGAKTDSSLLASVFTGAQVLPVASVNQLADRFREPRQALLAAKARSALASDADAPVTVEWPDRELSPGETKLDLTFRSTAKRLPLTISHVSTKSTNPHVEMRLVADKPIELPPGQAVTVPAVVRWSPPSSHAMVDTATADARITLTAEFGSKYLSVLQNDLDVKLGWRFTDNPRPFKGAVQVGHPYIWSSGIGAVVVLALMAVVVWWRRQNPQLHGRLLISCPYPARTLVSGRKLSGRRYEFNPEVRRALQGSARIRARWSNSRHNEAVKQLVVTYWPITAPHRKVKRIIECDNYVIINGVRFDWADV